MEKTQDQRWACGALDRFVTKMSVMKERACTKIPYTTKDGVYDDNSTLAAEKSFGIGWWTNGFWAGMMWLLYHETKEERYAEIARFSEEQLDTCFEEFYDLSHDLGFVYQPTAVADYRLTGSAAGRRRGLHAANLLAGRFNPAGNFIRAWNDWGDGRDTTGWAIIDCMMNLNLLYWASDELSDPRFRQIAMLHADTAMSAFVRPDGSVNHIVSFEPETGEILRSLGGQGYGDGSSWTRGQAWGLYGFALSYAHTGKQDYLDTAKRIAHYFISNIPEDGRIPVDFRSPSEPFYEDATAAAIAACGLLEITKHVPELEAGLYRNAAVKLLRTLDERDCDYDPETDGILRNCTAAYHDETHEFHIVYGDYFYLEALLKLKGSDFRIW